MAIIDMAMPDMDGVTLAREMAAVGPALSGCRSSWSRRSAGTRLQARAVRFAAFLTKPLKPSHLFDALVSVLGDRPAAPVVNRLVAPRKLPFDAEMGKRIPLRILLTEDNATNQKLALRVLERLGYRADVAGNGLEALIALERQRYDLVLMDIQMPELDGLEATRQIRLRWGDQIPPFIVAMTANAMEGDREACLAAGMNDYISKPIRVDALVTAIERAAAALGPIPQATPSAGGQHEQRR